VRRGFPQKEGAKRVAESRFFGGLESASGRLEKSLKIPIFSVSC
jgi:hypothetical protein